ncbi:LIC10260 family lipoprotein [Leptospira stimsonii]|uniref:Lipoprotein n=1 Tax=Leptospira stimsonii TaxID=2202203 RepID=A0ABY2MWN1_9LEPT|nr:hypothetical protein [Leptospira stimsonii]TGK23884.1 hypothetical protein EHO98_04280 [Leptospira stimsonii]TGM10408.1 hypothetical protein EHQ90_18240 [Leptospira stimsonii]
MKRSIRFLLLRLCLLILGCSQTPKKISYVILEKPIRPIEISDAKSKRLQLEKYRIGFGGLFPVELNSYLKEAESKASNSILKNVDIEMKFPICVLPLIPFVCFARYELVVEGETLRR